MSTDNSQETKIKPESKANTPQLLENTGVFFPVTTVPAKVTRDIQSDPYVLPADLPFAGGNVYHQDTVSIFARVITKPDSGGQHLSVKTYSSGRADYLIPVAFKVGDPADTSFVASTIISKGSGSLRALEESGSPFGERGFEIEGAATINDLRLDASNSLFLLKAGIRTRVALGIFTLDETKYEGKTYSPAELLKNELVTKNDDLPGIGVFASRTALRIEDIVDTLLRNKNGFAINALVGYLLITTEHDDSPEFSAFHQRHKDIIGKCEGLSPDQRNLIMSDYLVSLSGVLGRQAARFEKIDCIKVVNKGTEEESNKETEDNATCLGESVDNSQLVKGAGAGPMSEYQLSLLALPLNIRDYLVASSEEDMILYSKITTNFINAYLDEMAPSWRNSQDPDYDFLAQESQRFGTDTEDIKRIYHFILLKQKSIMADIYSGKDSTNSELPDIPLSWVDTIFKLKYDPDDRNYQNNKKFLAHMAEYQKLPDSGH